MVVTAETFSETAPAVLEIGILLLLAVASGWLARRIGLPAVLGYLVVGLIVSPFTPGYVANRSQLQVLADVGVVLLLFEVGIEIDPVRLIRKRSAVLWTAPIQVFLTTTVVGAAALALGLAFGAALLGGLSVALSSSVVVVAAWGLPRLLQALKAEHDLFLMLSVGSGLALAGVGAKYFGVPLALAAFVSGLAIVESPAAAEARQRILPFRDLFAVLFFVLLGSLIDPRALPRALPWIAFVLAAVVLAKALPAAVLSRLARLPDVRHWQLGIGLGQVGEFSFVLAGILAARGLITFELFTAMLSTVVLTIAASAVLVRVGKRPVAAGF